MKALTLVLIMLTAVSCRQQVPRGENIIFITLDGVRYQEFFNKDIFKKFWSDHAHTGIVLGDPKKRSKVRVANIMSLSLPAYRTIHTGRRTLCKTNNCGHTKRETFSEKIKDHLELPLNKVAVFSSWDGVCRGALREITHVLNSCSTRDVILPGHEEINKQSQIDLPVWKNARLDKYTWAHGFKYIKNHKPRLLTLSMNDSDEWGHDKDWKNYIQSLRDYDQKIHELFKLLNGMGEYGEKTLVFITTDHGRGKKKWWGHTLMRQARPIWMFLAGPGIPAKGSISHKKRVTHLHIKPFIEKYLGLK